MRDDEESLPSSWKNCEKQEAETRKWHPVRYDVTVKTSDIGSNVTLLTGLYVFSLSVSSAAVREAAEVSSPARIHLLAAAASSLYWYDGVVVSEYVRY